MITVKVLPDNDPTDPREFDTLGLLACWHRRHTLGDTQPDEEPTEWIKEHAPKGSVVLPVYLYDHGGLRMSTTRVSCAWDSGQVGVIVATPAAIRKCHGVQKITRSIRDKVRKCLTAEVQAYSVYLSGDVWGYVIASVEEIVCGTCDTRVRREDPAVGDSCWGFYGATLEATGMKDHVAVEHHEALEAAWGLRFSPVSP